MKSKLHCLVVTIVTIIILIGFLNLIPNRSKSTEILVFDNGGGEPSCVVEMRGEMGYCSDSTTYFSVPIHKGNIQEASVKIKCEPNSEGDTLLNPSLDVGLDGDNEWEFTGKGYGAINHQTIFKTGMNRKVVAIGKKTHSTNTTSILLPKGAEVQEAMMTIQGGDIEFGELYLAVTTEDTEVWYVKYDGNKKFCTPEKICQLGGSSWWDQSAGIGLGDFDDDNDNDIVVNYGNGQTSSTTGEIYLLEKKGSGNDFANKQLIGKTGNYRNTDFAVGDYDNDKKVDFVVSEQNQNIYYFQNNGSFDFYGKQLTGSFSGGTAYGKDAYDFNLDGYLDIVIGGSSSGEVHIFPGKGDGTFGSQIKVQLNSGRDNRCVVAGDYNIDGNPDIIVKDAQTWPVPAPKFQFASGYGDFTFTNSVDIDIDTTGWYLSYITGDGFDFNFDGNQDLVTYSYFWSTQNSTIYCYWGKGDGTFESTPTEVILPGQRITCIATPSSDVLGGCDNLVIDVGEDGDLTTNFQPVTGPFKTEEKIYFDTQLKNLFSTPSSGMRSFIDDYGNTIYEIPIRFSANEIGNVMLKNLSISYSYTAKVDVNPHNTNLVNELNDLIPTTGTGKFKVYFKIAADSPGKVTFSNLYIKFNEAPTFNPIPDWSMDEGTTKLIDIFSYYGDDYESPEELTYSVYSYTNSNYLDVSVYNNIYLLINATIDPDWHGETSIVVEAEDSENGITRSNKFKVMINPVNDPPRIGRRLTNVELKTNEVYDEMDLDDPNEYYFYDVDSTKMYFRAIINAQNAIEYNEYLEISINNDTNVLKLKSLDRYLKLIPVRIYCSDIETVRTMKAANLPNIPTYQDFIVNITKYGIGKKPTYPPVWKDIEDLELLEDETKINWLNLNNYTTDRDDTIESLTYSIESLTNSAFINVFITTNKPRTENVLSIIPELDFNGEAIAVIRVEDDEHNFALEEFKITIKPQLDIPEVEILSPKNGTEVFGSVAIFGRAYDPENALTAVEIKIGNEQWLPVSGDETSISHWNYIWDSQEYTTTTGNITIKARAIDADNMFSELDSIQLQVNNAIIDTDNDNVPDVYDAFPNDPLNWVDSDGDEVGDYTDQFPNEPSQWEDSDSDGYGDNPSGNLPDLFPLDPTQWEDSDGDGYGDNLDGNNPDYYPEDDKRHLKGDDQAQDNIFMSKNLIWLTIIPFIIIDLLIIFYYISRKKVGMKKQQKG